MVDELSTIFLREATAIADEIAAVLDAWEQGQSSGELEELKRLAHKLKGAAGTAGFVSVEDLAHAFEDVLKHAARRGGRLTGEDIADLQEAVTLMHLDIAAKLPRERFGNLLARLRERVNPASLPVSARLSSMPLHAGEVRLFDEEEESASSHAASAASSGEDKAEKTAAQAASRDGDEGATLQKASLHVDRGRLDHLMSFIGEILAHRARLGSFVAEANDLHRRCQQLLRDGGVPESLFMPVVEQVRTLRCALSDAELHYRDQAENLTEAMKAARMSPLSELGPVWRRIVREAAYLVDKRVDVEIDTGNIEIDSNVIEHLNNPLLHLLRNAVDHGIESAQERVAAGKPAHGRLAIRAHVEGRFVRLDVQDDGRGIDVDAVARRAVAAGVLDDEASARMTPAEKRNLIFKPAVSTARAVSKLSGRGIGLDIVRSEVVAQGGRVSVEDNVHGPGITFRLWLPISILSTRGVFVRAGTTTFVLPTEAIVETLRASQSELSERGGLAVLPLDQGKAPLRVEWLGELLEVPRYVRPHRFRVLRLQHEGQTMGVAVDTVLGEREHITTKLPWSIGEALGTSGAVPLDDGAVAVVLDVAEIFVIADGREWRGAIDERSSEVKRVLVVDDSLTSRTVAQSMIAAAGYAVVLAHDGQHAWELLQAERIDLVATDVEMPRMDGLELTRRIRAHSRLKSLPVLLMSKHDSKEDVARGLEAGANEYLVKGTYDQSVLLERMARYV